MIRDVIRDVRRSTRQTIRTVVAFIIGVVCGWASWAPAQDPPASRLECFSTCDEFNRYAIRCGCGNTCMFRRDAGADAADTGNR